jgi:Na+/melibiose symporter-like transporter
MTSKAITAGVGIPMIIVGALMAWLWAPIGGDLQNQVELVGSTIGILGVIFFIAGLFYTKEPVMH